MKTKVLNSINVFLTMVLTALGFSCFSCTAEYGCPPLSTLNISGNITNEELVPLKNIRITLKEDWWRRVYENNQEYNHDYFPTIYTGEDGRYNYTESAIYQWHFFDIIVEDSSGVYAPDSMRVEPKWHDGKATIEQNFQLKKK